MVNAMSGVGICEVCTDLVRTIFYCNIENLVRRTPLRTLQL